MRNKQILLIGPLPPPIGGETVSTSRLIGSRHWADAGAEIATINLYGDGGMIKLPGERIYAKDVLRAVRVLFEFVRRLPGKDIVLLWITRRSLCSLGLANQSVAPNPTINYLLMFCIKRSKWPCIICFKLLALPFDSIDNFLSM